MPFPALFAVSCLQFGEALLKCLDLPLQTFNAGTHKVAILIGANKLKAAETALAAMALSLATTLACWIATELAAA